MIHFKVNGQPASARMPTMAELTTLIAEGLESPLALKKLAKACVVSPTYAEVSKGRAAIGPQLGIILAGSAGMGAPVVELDTEDDDIPEEVAAAFVALEAKGMEELAILRTTITTPQGDVDSYFIQRMPNERACDEYMKHEKSVEGAKKMVETITAYPEKTAHLQQEAPGLYVSLARHALRRAGLFEAIELGE